MATCGYLKKRSCPKLRGLPVELGPNWSSQTQTPVFHPSAVPLDNHRICGPSDYDWQLLSGGQEELAALLVICRRSIYIMTVRGLWTCSANSESLGFWFPLGMSVFLPVFILLYVVGIPRILSTDRQSSAGYHRNYCFVPRRSLQQRFTHAHYPQHIEAGFFLVHMVN